MFKNILISKLNSYLTFESYFKLFYHSAEVSIFIYLVLLTLVTAILFF